MGLSGVIGLALGDFGYFGALALIGPRRGVLLMSLAPVFSSLSAFFALGEILRLWAMIGIVITLSGICVVILEREESSDEVPLYRRQKTLGVLLGLGGSLGQGIGLVVSKYGMIAVADSPSAPLNPLSATLIRMITATIFIWISMSEDEKFFSRRHRLNYVIDDPVFFMNCGDYRFFHASYPCSVFLMACLKALLQP